MDHSFQYGSSPQLPPTSDLNSHGPNFLNEWSAEQQLDAVESLLTASNTFSGMDEYEIQDLTAPLSTIRAFISPEGRLRATRNYTNNLDSEPATGLPVP